MVRPRARPGDEHPDRPDRDATRRLPHRWTTDETGWRAVLFTAPCPFRSLAPGYRPWRPRVLFYGSSHERSFLKRTDQEPPHPSRVATRSARRAAAGRKPIFASARPRSRAYRGSVQDWPIIPVGVEGATIAPPEIATATSLEPLGHASPCRTASIPGPRSGPGPSVADQRHDRLGTFTADGWMTRER